MNLNEYLQTLPTQLLLALAQGEIDAKALAAIEMAGRGLDKEGRWVGFPQAAEVWSVDKAA